MDVEGIRETVHDILSDPEQTFQGLEDDFVDWLCDEQSEIEKLAEEILFCPADRYHQRELEPTILGDLNALLIELEREAVEEFHMPLNSRNILRSQLHQVLLLVGRLKKL